MAKRTRQTTNDDALPHSDQDAPHESPNGAYNPFLKTTDVRPAPGITKLMLTGWTRRTVGRYGPQIVIEVQSEIDGKLFDFGIKEGSPNHRMIWRAMGADEKQWKGNLFVNIERFKIGNRLSEPAINIREVEHK